jgi:hypothetical protein
MTPFPDQNNRSIANDYYMSENGNLIIIYIAFDWRFAIGGGEETCRWIAERGRRTTIACAQAFTKFGYQLSAMNGVSREPRRLGKSRPRQTPKPQGA